ncbi:MAG: substrate-binding domain-containing protein [Alphaproteobacteria bacterium]|nr:substrate-binding domain-containing protein [Alphaproteobacteria bacterium]
MGAELTWCLRLAGIVVAVAATAVHAEMRDDPMPGPAFSNPAVLTNMPSDWQSRPLHREPAEADISVVLDQQIYPALLPFIQEFARSQHLRIAVQSGTCGTALGGLTRKDLDIGGYCCPPEQADRLPGVKFHTVGITAISLIVHPKNPIDNLTRDEARKIFSGEYTLWRQVRSPQKQGTPGGSVFVATRLHCKTRPGHWRLLLDNANLFSSEIQEVGSIPDMIRTVSVEHDAIGYETVWHVNLHSTTSPVRTITMDGIDPRDDAAMVQHRYPLYEVMNMTTWEGPAANPAADRLVAYLLSKGGDVGKVYGMVPADRLRKAGWKFKDDELIGEPDPVLAPRQP